MTLVVSQWMYRRKHSRLPENILALLMREYESHFDDLMAKLPRRHVQGWKAFAGGRCVFSYLQWGQEYNLGPLSGSESKGLDFVHRSASSAGDTTDML